MISDEDQPISISGRSAASSGWAGQERTSAEGGPRARGQGKQVFQTACCSALACCKGSSGSQSPLLLHLSKSHR